MTSVSEDLIKTLLNEFKTISRTDTIIGKEFQAGEYALIPTGGGGIRIEPIAFIAIRGEDISFHGIKKGGTIEAILEKIPDMAERIMKKRDERKTQKREAKKES